ncbi:MAG: hypothetical protein ACETVQ_02635 [Candidatus Bathyarchaeia archaeon]
MVRLVGLYKELGDNEHLVIEGKIIVPTVFVREAKVKKFMGHEKKGFPLSYLMSGVFLTNKRLMFLIFRELEALILQKKRIPSLAGIEGSWFEIPTSAIYNVEVVRKELKKDKEMRAAFPALSKHETVSTVEIFYNGQRASGKLKDYIESIFSRDGMAKRFNLKNIEAIFDKVQLVGEQTVGIVPKLKEVSKFKS